SLRGLPDGVVVDSLAAVLGAHPEWAEPYLARYARFEANSFTALNTAFLRDGAFVSVPKGKVVTGPIHLLFLSTPSGASAVAHPRTLIVAGTGSQATVIEPFLGPQAGVYFTNGVTEVILGENAGIDHYKVQRESAEAFHVATTQIHQGRDSRF